MESKHKLKAAIATTLVALASQHAAAQSLNEAVANQLGQDAQLGQNCSGLIDPNGGFNSLADGLARICGRPAEPGTDRPSLSGGGGAGTATNVPAPVRERMEREKTAADDEQAYKFSFFASAGVTPFDRSVSTFEDGYTSDIGSITAGVDTRLNNGATLGVALTGARQTGDFANGGALDVNSIGLTAFAATSVGESGYLQAYAGANRSSHDRTRLATLLQTNNDEDDNPVIFETGGLQAAEFDATETTAGIAFGYPLSFDNITFGPVLSWDYSNTRTDEYAESFRPSALTVPSNGADEELAAALALNFYDTSEISRVTSVGFEGSAAISTTWGVVMFEQNVFWRFEGGRDQRLDEVSFVQDTLERRFTFLTEADDDQYMEYSLGLNFMRASGLNLYINYSAIASHRFYNTRQFTAGFHWGL